MKIAENGILTGSEIFFSSPSPISKRLLYYPIALGHFYCNSSYYTKRDSYDSYLYIYVIKGVIRCYPTMNTSVPITGNESGIIDCHKPHQYYSDTDTEFLWFHFDGADSAALCSHILQGKLAALCTNMPSRASDELKEMLSSFSFNSVSESFNSSIIYNLLCSFLSPASEIPASESSLNILMRDTKNYILEHLSENLSIPELAANNNLSTSHFTRLFKQYTGFSPYDYVLTMRLDRAKCLLYNSSLSILEIAYAVGFNSEANFIYFFHKDTGYSPLKFRKLKF